MHDALRTILMKFGRVPHENLRDNESDLFAAGLDSFGMVDVMMVVEEEFDVVFTPAALNRRSFATLNTLAAVVAGLKDPGQAGIIAGATPDVVADQPVVR